MRALISVGFVASCLLFSALLGCGGGEPDAPPEPAANGEPMDAPPVEADPAPDDLGAEPAQDFEQDASEANGPTDESGEPMPGETDIEPADYEGETPYTEEEYPTPGPDFEDEYPAGTPREGGHDPDYDAWRENGRQPADGDEYGMDPDEYGRDMDTDDYDIRREQPREVTYLDQAREALHRGDEKAATRFLYAYALTAEAEEAKWLLDTMGFSRLVGQPSFLIRWGIGVEYQGPPQVANVFPIGTYQQIPGQPAPKQPARGGPDDGFDPGGPPGDRQRPGTGDRGIDPELLSMTGELGETVVQQLKLRLERGDYGHVLTPTGLLLPDDTAEATNGQAAGRGAGAGAGRGAGGYGGGRDADWDPEYSPAGTDAGLGRQRPRPESELVRSMAPGLAVLPMASTREQIALARKLGLDALIVFQVQVSIASRTNLVTNDTGLQLYDVASGKELFRTRRPLRNLAIQHQRAKGEDDTVAKTLVALFQEIDQNCRLGALPAMTREAVLNRIRDLLSKKTPETTLATLAEIRMYHTRELLTEAHLLVAYNQLVGEPIGKTLATGSAEERKQIVAAMLEPATREIEAEGPAPAAKPADILERTGPRDILDQAGP